MYFHVLQGTFQKNLTNGSDQESAHIIKSVILANTVELCQQEVPLLDELQIAASIEDTYRQLIE